MVVDSCISLIVTTNFSFFKSSFELLLEWGYYSRVHLPNNWLDQLVHNFNAILFGLANVVEIKIQISEELI